MKLNLLPSDVAKKGAATGMWFVAGLMALASIVLAVGMVVMSRNAKAEAKQNATDKMQAAANAVATAQVAEKQVALASVINRNQKLAESMLAHNRKYVDIYRDVMRYVPSYYRLTSISAQPTGEGTCSMTLVGQIETYSRYADVAIAMWKVPDVTSVTRAGYTIDEPNVLPLTESDQRGSYVRPGQSALPSDPLARLDEMIARAANEPRGYQNLENYGSTTPDQRGPMPGWSTVTMTLLLNRDLRTPDPRATLSTNPGSTGGAPGAPGTPGGGFQAPPGGTGNR